MDALSPQKSLPVVISFAATDSTGGASIQAELMTIPSMGCHTLSVISALTVQDTLGVNAVLPTGNNWCEDQARTMILTPNSLEARRLASALVASLAHGLSVSNVLRKAQEYTWQTLAAGIYSGSLLLGSAQG